MLYGRRILTELSMNLMHMENIHLYTQVGHMHFHRIMLVHL